MEKITAIILVALIAGPLGFILYRKTQKILTAKKFVTKEAFFFHQDLGKKIEELETDPTLSEQDWEIILEIAKFADQRFLSKCPEKINTDDFVSLAEIVAEIIEERRESK